MLKKFFKNFLVALLGAFLQTLEVAFFIYGSKHIWRRGNLFLYDSDNLRQKEIEAQQNSLVAQNHYQKKLVYPNMNNEAANVSKTFLIVSIVTDVILLLITYIFFLVN